MDGRYAKNRATTPSPNAASRKARALVGTSRGRTKPSVKSDEPLSTKAVRQLDTPRAWNIIVNPPRIIASHTTGSRRSDIGAYSAMTRSRASYVLHRPAIRSNTRRVISQRSEEHTSELQSQSNLVCRLLLEKKKKKQ